MGDRIAVIDHGTVRQVGTPPEIYDDPADRFVATFVATPPMNLITWNSGHLGFRPEQFLPKQMIEEGPASEFQFRVSRVEYPRLRADRLRRGRWSATRTGGDGEAAIGACPARQYPARRMARICSSRIRAVLFRQRRQADDAPLIIR